jgi:outer membrane protein OmpA-like peptidoglycan-associated protein
MNGDRIIMLIKKSSDGNPPGTIRGLLALIIVCLVGFFNSAGAASGVGYSGAPFLKISPAARQVAMGEAFTALSNDVNLMRYNVGGLGGIKFPSLGVNFNTWIDDTQQGNIAFAYPFKNIGVIGLDMTYFDEGQITQLDQNFVPVGGNGISGDILMSLGYGRFWGSEGDIQYGFGLAGKYLTQSLVGETSSVFAMDAGLQVRLPRLLAFGAGIQNFGLSKMKFDVWQSPLPEIYKLGAALILPIAGNADNLTELTLAADALYTKKEQIKYFLGSELFISHVFALRGGYKFNETSMSNWAAGFGVNIPASWLGSSMLRLDYAYAPLPAFDEAAHRFSLHFAFGEVPQKKDITAADNDSIQAQLQRNLEAAERARREAELAAQRAKGYENELKNKMARVDSLLHRLGPKASDWERIPPDTTKPQVGYKFAVYFDFDKTDILPSDYPTLKTVGEILNTDPYSKVQLSGHTDWIGEEDYNINLSQRRLDSVIEYLSTEEKVSMGRFFMPVGYGESRPVADNRTDEGRQKNRRVEFNIYFRGNEPPIPDGTAIRDVRALDENTVQIECNGRIGLGKTLNLSNPDRLVIDFDNIYLLSNDRDIQLNRGPFIKARLGYHGDGAVKYTRVVLDTQYPVGGNLSVDRNYIIVKRKPVLEQSLEKKN